MKVTTKKKRRDSLISDEVLYLSILILFAIASYELLGRLYF